MIGHTPALARALRRERCMQKLHSTRLSFVQTKRYAAEGIERHRDYLFHNALGRLRNREAAEDATGREICDALGISENNLWIILHRARKQLREQILPWRSVT